MGLKRKQVLVIDNYDSFTYNLVQYLGQLGCEIRVKRNNKTTIREIEKTGPDAIIVSPGPRTPDEAGIVISIIKHLGESVPILGVCLGHQAIGRAFGARVIRGAYPIHGKTSAVYHDGKTIYKGIVSPFTAGRYHSLVIEAGTVPACLEVTARTAEGVVMGVRHKTWPVEGVQFHPESILTESGLTLLENFLNSF